MLNHPYRSAVQYIPLAKGDAQPSTRMNPEADFNPTSSLDNWLLNHFGKVQDQEDQMGNEELDMSGGI